MRPVLLMLCVLFLLGGGKPTSVTIQDMAFQPATVTIAPGEKVSFTNANDRDHKVAFKDGNSSPNLKPGQSWTRGFKDPGTYDYSCEYRPRMRGKVVVKD